jgi:S-adenosylmethionine hydrolase
MGHTFLAPDNGVLTLIIDEGDIDTIVHVDNSSYFLESVSRTFHGRDIFAPVSGYISKGIKLTTLGAPVDPRRLVRLDIRKPYVSDKGELVGTIISIDRFGNLITNIDSKSLGPFCGKNKRNRIEIEIGEDKVIGLSQSYESAGRKRPLAIIGSRGYLELAVNCGSARQYFMAGKGDAVRVCRPNDRFSSPKK